MFVGYGIGFFIILLIFLTPKIDNVILESEGKNIVPASGKEIAFRGSQSPTFVRFGLHTNALQRHTLHATVKGCLREFSVNGSPLPLPLPCTASGIGLLKQNLDLTSFLENGWNHVQATVTSPRHMLGKEIQFSFLPSVSSDPGFTVIRWYSLLLLVALTLLILRKWVTKNVWIALIVIVGVVIRWKYAFSTDLEVRSYDWWGHIEYVRFLMKEWSIPPASKGWGFHHPPLYYAFGSILANMGEMLRWPQGFSEFWIRLCSLPLSIAVLMLSTWIGAILFRKHQPWLLYMFIGVIATLPSFVMASSRLTNDALVMPLIFLGCGMLLVWQGKPQWKLWIWIWIVAALAFLTKGNGAVIIPSAILCALFQRQVSIRHRITLCFWGLLILSIPFSWIMSERFRDNPADIRTYTSVGAALVNPALRVEPTLLHFVVFNPVEILKHPFVNTYSDESRRQYYFEFLFRSAFFGEFALFNRPQFSIPILLYSLLLLPWIAWGFFKEYSVKKKDSTAFLLFSLSVFCMGIVGMIIVPLSPVADLRYSLFLALPAAFFLVRGIYASPPLLRMAGTMITVFLCVLMGAFMFVQ